MKKTTKKTDYTRSNEKSSKRVFFYLKRDLLFYCQVDFGKTIQAFFIMQPLIQTALAFMNMIKRLRAK
ncbi:hypothetical protein GCM10020331_068230 [Ectobacillus funiculus]